MSDAIGIDKELHRNVFRLVENRFSVIVHSGPIGYINFQILADIRGFLNIPILFFVVIGTANGTNFTDGLDGLVSSVTVMVATFFTVAAIGTQGGIAPVTCAVTGALLGFLLFNVHPASVFMGDTGSLVLGGFVAASAYMLQMPLFLPIVGLIYVLEVLSVILQVVYYKASGGRRLFKMAPLHHHFELCGLKETRIVTAFSIVTALLCLLALLGI